MAYGDVTGSTAGSRPREVRLDWRSALTGGGIVMVVAYVGLVAPAWRQVTALEGQVARLATAVNSLNESRDGVSRATSLLERLEAQAARLAAAEATLERFETLATRMADQAEPAEDAGLTMDRIDALHASIIAGTDQVAEAETAMDSRDAVVRFMSEKSSLVGLWKSSQLPRRGWASSEGRRPSPPRRLSPHSGRETPMPWEA